MKQNESTSWIQTYSGKKFFPLDPQEADVCIEDIAHSLSMICRFTGHCKEFYSVAQHSVMVSYLSGEFALYGLLHDASEAYICDLASPIKSSGHFDTYKAFENKLQSVIFRKFGLFGTEPPIVKKADTQMLSTEARDLLGELHPEWVLPTEPLPMTVNPLGQKEAKELFMKRFNELYQLRTDSMPVASEDPLRFGPFYPPDMIVSYNPSPVDLLIQEVKIICENPNAK